VSTAVSGVDLVDWFAPEGSPIVLGGTLVDGTGADPLPDAVLVIREDRIVAVGARADVSIPESAQLYDLPQATLLPGFINTHVHNTARTTYLKLWAQAGVTTVRDLGARVSSPYFDTRDRLRSDPQTARILAAGPLVTVRGGYPIAGADFPSLVVLTPDDARQKIGNLIESGADVIKITLESAAGPILSPEMAAAIVETAHLHWVPVSAHVTRAADLERALDAGVDDIAHIVIDHVSDEMIQRMIDMDVSWVPTFDAMGGRGTENLKRFVQAGGRVALGNDAGYLPGLEFGMPMEEIGWMETAGMTPIQIIVAGTGDAAHVCRRAGALGTLEVGKLADILVVEGDPLRDLGALENVQIVVHSGTVIRGAGKSR
jgi:imidazolonepropionase-like amidohydrolase